MIIEYMLDCETLGTDNDAPVWEVAVVQFAMDEKFVTKILSTWTFHFDTSYQIHENGKRASPETMEWMRNTPGQIDRFNASQEVFVQAAENGDDFDYHNVAIASLRRVLRGTGAAKIWCRGVLFDFPKIADLLGEEPWHYRAPSCLRSVYAEAERLGMREKMPTGNHSAHEDCIAQINQLALVRRFLTGQLSYDHVAVGYGADMLGAAHGCD